MIVKKDLLDCGAHVIVQQLNCLTVKYHGLSASITRKFRYANVYGRRVPTKPRGNLARREDRAIPGTISISSPATLGNQDHNACRVTGVVMPRGQTSLLSCKRIKLDTSYAPQLPTSSCRIDTKRPVVVGMFGQYEMGYPHEYKRLANEGGGTDAEQKDSIRYDDSKENRFVWFKQCLDKLFDSLPRLMAMTGCGDVAIDPSSPTATNEATLTAATVESKKDVSVQPEAKSSTTRSGTFVVAFPYGIGCGLARGDWNLYHPEIIRWAERAKKIGCDTIICQQ